MLKRYGSSAAAIAGITFMALSLTACPPRVSSLHLIFDQGDYGTGALTSYVAQQVADDFVLTTGLSTVRHLTWWGLESGSISMNGFIVRIFEDDGTDHPKATPLYSFPLSGVSREATGSLSAPAWGSRPIYEYSVDLMSISVEPARIYYLSIVHNTGLWDWMRRNDAVGGQYSHYRSEDSGLWTSMHVDMAFRLWQ